MIKVNTDVLDRKEMEKKEILGLYFDVIHSGEKIELEEISKQVYIYSYNDKKYGVLKRIVQNFFYECKYDIDSFDYKIISSPSQNYNNFIVDFNGIDNFMTSTSLVFHDSLVRSGVKFFAQHDKYLRFGVSGSRPCNMHPGGEVVEIQNIDFSTNKGISYSLSGAIDISSGCSVATKLSTDNIHMRDERTVYSHTAWIESIKGNCPIKIDFVCKKEMLSLLSMIYEFCKNSGIHSCGIRMKLRNFNKVVVRGRVLKHIPSVAFKVLQEATDIADEKEFILPNGSEMHIVGTLYNRYEPEWKCFTGGHQYEKRGHFHACILENIDNNIHEVFHVRDVYLNVNDFVSVEIYPINMVYRFYPLKEIDDDYFINSSMKKFKDYSKHFFMHKPYLK